MMILVSDLDVWQEQGGGTPGAYLLEAVWPIMAGKVLITGGAGFIGAHVGVELLDHGHEVRALDVLDPQIHADGRPPYLHPEIELMVGDVADREAVRRSLRGIDSVVHLAARVGVGAEHVRGSLIHASERLRHRRSLRDPHGRAGA